MIVSKLTCPSFFSILFFISADGYSQLSRVPKWEAGIQVGAFMYQGDLTPHPVGSIETVRPGIGITGTRILNRSFAVRAMFILAGLAADESVYKYPDWRQQRNFSFSASVKELSLSLHWNVLGTGYDDVKYEPYVFAGAGASFVSVSRNYSRVNYTYFGEKSTVQQGLVIDAAASSQQVIPVVPVGAGLRYHVSERIVLNLEGSYRFMHNDYLDGFSFSANPGFRDHYSSLTIGAAYKFGGKEKYGCPSAN